MERPDVKVGDHVRMTNNEFTWYVIGPPSFIVSVDDVNGDGFISGVICNLGDGGQIRAHMVPWLRSEAYQQSFGDGWTEVLTREEAEAEIEQWRRTHSQRDGAEYRRKMADLWSARDEGVDFYHRPSSITFHNLKELELFIAVRGMDKGDVARSLVREAAAIGINIRVLHGKEEE